MASEVRPVVTAAPTATRAPRELTSWVLGALVCTVIVVGFALNSVAYMHWFVLPILLCGILLAKDVMDWARGLIDTFDPAAMLAIFGMHGLFVSYLLAIHYGPEIFWWVQTPPDSWREWLGYMATLNLAGLFIYRFVRQLRLGPSRPPTTVWRLDTGRFWRLWLIVVPMLVIFVALVFMKVGGYKGYVEAQAVKTYATKEHYPLHGYGWMVTFAERLPSVLWLGLIVYFRTHRSRAKWWVIGLALFVLFAMQLAVAGPRGSRSAILLALVEGIMLVHFCVRRVPRLVLMVGLAGMMGFVYLYGFYKTAAMDALPAMWSSQARAQLAEETGRSMARVLLDDTSRGVLQTYMLYRLSRSTNDYQYALGRTYAAALVHPIPRKIWPDKPVAKHKEVAEAMMGGHVGDWGSEAHKVVGLQGETLLNFTAAAIPLSFALLGIIIQGVRRLVSSWGPDDSRLLFVAILLPLGIRVLHGDSANMAIQLTRYAVTILPLVLFSTRRFRASVRPDRAE